MLTGIDGKPLVSQETAEAQLHELERLVIAMRGDPDSTAMFAVNLMHIIADVSMSLRESGQVRSAATIDATIDALLLRLFPMALNPPETEGEPAHD